MYPHSISFDAIGTHWKIDALEALSGEVERAIHERIEKFDQAYSRFRSDSLVTKMADEGGTFTLPADAGPLFGLYETLYRTTQGAFTPLIGNVLSDAGYDASYSLAPKSIRPIEMWDDAITYSFPEITIKKGTLLDFGAGGKGYLVDLVADVLRSYHISSYCIDAGGDMRYEDEQATPLRVGLEHPLDTTKAIGVATLTNQCIAGSAGNRRAWGEYHHIIDPSTLRPTVDVSATWVIAKTALVADALATCLFFVAPESLADEYKFEYLILDKEMRVKRSVHFPAELFT